MWVKPPEARCHTKYKLGTVTKVIFEQTMEVDGMPRHVRDLRSAVPPETAPTRAQIFISDDEELPLLPARLLCPGEAAARNDSRIVTDFDDYDNQGECNEHGCSKQDGCYVVNS